MYRSLVFAPLALLSTVLSTASLPAQAQCRLCSNERDKLPATPPKSLTIDVEAVLDLGRAAQTRAGGGGSISLDARTGERRVAGGLADLGGFSVKGIIRLTGVPFAPVAVSMPARIPLTAPDGSTADIVDLQTDLSSAASLDAQGQLRVAFGGRLIVTAGQAGDFRGRITVVADYR